MTVYRWCKALNKPVDYIFIISHLQKFELLVITELSCICPWTCFESVFLQNIEGNHIQIGWKHRFYYIFRFLSLVGLCTINSNYLNSITWAYCIYITVIRNDRNWAGCLSFGDLFWELLEFYKLFISESAKIVNDLKRILCMAPTALCRLLNFCIVKWNLHLMSTRKICASKERTLHLWKDLWCPDRNSFKTKQLIDRCWI